MIYLFKCRVCGFHFTYAEGGEILCPKCEAKYVRRVSKRNVKNVKVAKRGKYTGHFVKITKKRCQKCSHSEETATLATIRCTLLTPETMFRKKENSWVCYSFKIANNCKKMKR